MATAWWPDLQLIGFTTMNAAGYRFIVADDDERARFIIEFALRRAFPDAALTCVADGWEALQRFTETGADAIITDHSMPELTGADLARAIRRHHATVPIVMVSNSPFAEKEGLAAGVNCYLDKGVAMQSLPEILLELLSRSSPSEPEVETFRS